MDRRANFPIHDLYPDWRPWSEKLGEMFSRLVGQTPDDQVPYVLVLDQKSAGVAGGTFTQGAWQTRDLGTKAIDKSIGAVLSSNQIQLPKGRYSITASAPANNVAAHRARLYNVTGAAVLLHGTSERANATVTRSWIIGLFDLKVTSSIRLEHYCASTQATDGFGVALGQDLEIYTQVELWGIL